MSKGYIPPSSPNTSRPAHRLPEADSAGSSGPIRPPPALPPRTREAQDFDLRVQSAESGTPRSGNLWTVAPPQGGSGRDMVRHLQFEDPVYAPHERFPWQGPRYSLGFRPARPLESTPAMPADAEEGATSTQDSLDAQSFATQRAMELFALQCQFMSPQTHRGATERRVFASAPTELRASPLTRSAISALQNPQQALIREIAKWEKLAVVHQGSLQQDNLRSHEQKILQSFLERLQDTAEFKAHGFPKQNLVRRVADMLSIMRDSKNVDLRETWLAYMLQYNTSCEDAVIGGMDEIENAAQIFHAEHSSDVASALRHLAVCDLRRLVVRVEVKLLIERETEKRQSTGLASRPDDLEAYLKVQNALQRLEPGFLGFSTTEMLYTFCASYIHDHEILAIYDKAKRIDSAETEAHLATYEPWLRYQRGEAIKHFSLATESSVPVEVTADQCCIISQNPVAELKQPVVIVQGDAKGKGAVNSAVYELKDLLEYWRHCSLDPVTHQPFALEDIRAARILR